MKQPMDPSPNVMRRYAPYVSSEQVMRPNNELSPNVLSLRRRIFGSGAVDMLRRRSLQCALTALLFTLTVCVPPANAQDQLETAYARIRPSLVFVVNYHGGHPSATGTGFVVGHRDGHMLIVTNAHVVEGGDAFRGLIQFPKEVSFGLTVLKVGTSDDLALLESTELNAPALTLATTLPALGHAVSIAGYPHTQIVIAGAGGGLTSSVHAGNVNALPNDGYYIQYDAQTDHGNSGGPLFDLDSSLVYGIVVLKLGSIETNFAISAVRLRTFLANEGVFPSPPPAVVAAAPIATVAPSPAPLGSIDRAACASAVIDFVQNFEVNLQNFNRWNDAGQTNVESLGVGTYRERLDRFNSFMDVQLNTIRSIIRDDEPKLYGPRDRVAKAGAVVTAQQLETVITDTATRDQNALQGSLLENSLLAAGFNGRTPDREIAPYGPMATAMYAQVVHDLIPLKKGACTH